MVGPERRGQLAGRSLQHVRRHQPPLEPHRAAVDQRRAINVGVAEANMMLIGEAFAALGFNTWTSTFCPFFNWQVLRRTAVGQQERLEAIAATTSPRAARQVHTS